MKRIVKQLIITSIFIVVIMQTFTMVFAVSNVPAATSEFYVNDFANVFTADEKADLIKRASEFANTSEGIQVVITTIKSLDGNAVEDYANAMYNQYKIGKDDMGLLILLSTDDRKVRVEVGKKMEAYINDAKSGRIMDKYAIPKLKVNKFNEGLISLQTELINEIKVCIDNSKTPVESKESTKEPITIDWGMLGMVFLAIIFFGIIFIIAFIIYKKTKKNEELEETIAELNSQLESIDEESSKKINRAIREKEEISSQKQLLEGKYNDLDAKYNKLKDRYRRGVVLFPELDAQVDHMIEEEERQYDMDKANSADSVINQVISLSASKEAISKLEHALDMYNSLTKKQQGYVKSDISKVRDLYEQSKKLKYQYLASVAVASITAIVSAIYVGKEKDIRNLEGAKSTYDQLDSESKKYVDRNIIEKLSQLLTQAKQDKKDREDREEEERRIRIQQQQEDDRRNSYNSDSFGGGSSSGFGGSSGGGGASRDF